MNSNISIATRYKSCHENLHACAQTTSTQLLLKPACCTIHNNFKLWFDKQVCVMQKSWSNEVEDTHSRLNLIRLWKSLEQRLPSTTRKSVHWYNISSRRMSFPDLKKKKTLMSNMLNLKIFVFCWDEVAALNLWSATMLTFTLNVTVDKNRNCCQILKGLDHFNTNEQNCGHHRKKKPHTRKTKQNKKHLH